ncbi:MAG: integration host factor subunit alpha [Magnetococcales bacterium]|nr:integration host factor subunit alpha [Magnetococcales bacterium]
MTEPNTTKADLINTLEQRLSVSKRETQDILDALFELIKIQLGQGHAIKLPGFGNFSVRQKRERVGRNPKTGAAVPITARKVVSFKPSSILRERVDAGKKSYL